jgi:hypothetical protein
MCARAVIDVEKRFIGREAEAVRLHEIAGDQLNPLARFLHPVDTLERQVLLALDAENRHPPIGRVAKVDAGVLGNDDIVRAVQLLALVARGHDLATAIRVKPYDATGGVLAHQKVAVGLRISTPSTLSP